MADGATKGREEDLRVAYQFFVRECERLSRTANHYAAEAQHSRLAHGELLAVVRAAVAEPTGLEMLRRFVGHVDTAVATMGGPARERILTDDLTGVL
jgi:hypothetical protein